MSYTQLLYHIVFRTKGSLQALPIEYETPLYNYIWGIVKHKKTILYRIGGMPDHIHLLIDLHPSLALSDFIRDLKISTNKWLKENKEQFPIFYGWGTGYAAFSYSLAEKETIINYIANQKTHHKTLSFADEYRNFIVQNGGEIDDRYFLKD